ncbi:hypothetical protein MPER_11680 [Moniliophthora perniciosa FA553]|nr:hypothetical protein MPER_11680 [Moniliophthora perniciosa FA553]
MDNDDDTQMMDVDSIPASAKGKGRALDMDVPPIPDNENLPWVEKYRPVTLDDVVSHKEITGTSKLRNSLSKNIKFIIAVGKFIEKNRLPHLLFYGPPGTGKTSTILAVARRIYGPDTGN